MKKFLPLLLCLLLSIFTVARAMRPTHTAGCSRKGPEKNPTRQEADAKPLLNDENTDEQTGTDDGNNVAGTSDNQDDNVNDDDGGDAPGDQETGDNHTGDDEGADDGGGDGGQ